MQVIYQKNGLVVCHTDDIQSDEKLLIHKACLNDDQMDMLSEMKDATNRKLWLIARVLTMQFFQSTIQYRPNGAPYMVNKEGREISTNVSISHTSNFIAVYFSDTPCGVDIELNNRNATRISRKFTNCTEVEIVKKRYEKNPELLIWCAKEVLYKKCAIESAQFKEDFKILSFESEMLVCEAFGSIIKVGFYEINEKLLIAYSK